MTTDFKLLAQILTGKGPANYWETLGRFMSVFSLVEENMQVTLWQIVGIKAPVAPAIFSGTRVDVASGYIKRIAEAENWSKTDRDSLDYVFAQLAEITRVRNDILHYGAKASGADEWNVTNKLVAHTAKRTRNTKISVAILENMIHDLYKIIFHLAAIPHHGKGFHYPVAVEKVLNAAWRYKPERQSDPPGKRPKLPRKPRRPPDASEA